MLISLAHTGTDRPLVSRFLVNQPRCWFGPWSFNRYVYEFAHEENSSTPLRWRVGPSSCYSWRARDSH